MPSWLPLLGTLAIGIVNEVVDLWVEIWPERAMQAGEAGKDILTTVAIPALLCVAFRIAPRLTGQRPERRR